MRVVGYYNSFARPDSLKKLFLTPVTHINYAFLLPKEDGTLYFYDEDNVRDVVAFAHEKGKKVYVSVGGFCDQNKILSSVFEKICSDTNKLATFFKSIFKVVIEYGFDGVDIDWEYPTEKFVCHYELLIEVLSIILHAINKGLTIAVHRAIEDEQKLCRIVAITDLVISYVDWINIMTYDATEDDNHSSLYRCIKCVDYWHNKRKVPRNKILVGTAFYGKPSEKPYYELISENRKNYFKNHYQGDTYNGCYLVKEKAYFARLNCGGLIIWAINYDTFDETSLLKVINEAL